MGAFYARFDAKDALLERLLRRTDERFRSVLGTHLAGPRWSRPETESRLAELFDALLTFHRRELGMLRTLLRRAEEEPGARRHLERLDGTLLERLDAQLPRARQSWSHPDPDRGIEDALDLTLGALRAWIVHPGPGRGASGGDDRERAAGLARAFVGVAGLGAPGGGLFR